MNIREAQFPDLIGIQDCNVQCLPVSYRLSEYATYLCFQPGLTYVAEDHKGEIVGYVLARIMTNDDVEPHGHIVSIAVKGKYRRLGIGRMLVDQVLYAMLEIHHVKYVSLNVQVSNKTAIRLYFALGFYIDRVRYGYYNDGEDGLAMRRNLIAFGLERGLFTKEDPMMSKYPRAMGSEFEEDEEGNIVLRVVDLLANVQPSDDEVENS